MAVDDGGERGAQIRKRIDRIEFAGLYKRGNGRPVLRSGIMSSEERVLAIEGYRSDGSLDGVVVDLDPTVTQEDAEAVPVFGDIGECFAKRRLASDAGTMMRKPGPHVGNQWR